MKRLIIPTLALSLLIAGCGGGGTGTNGGGNNSKSFNPGTPPVEGGRPIGARSREAGPPTTRGSYSIGTNDVHWWVLYPTAGYTFQIHLSPSFGDQDLYVYSGGRWLASQNYGQYADSVTFRANSSEPVYVAVHGYIGGSYDIWAAYGY